MRRPIGLRPEEILSTVPNGTEDALDVSLHAATELVAQTFRVIQTRLGERSRGL